KYTLWLSFPSTQYHGNSEDTLFNDTFVRWGALTIDGSSDLTQDIHILSGDNAVLGGHVIDSNTGCPINSESVQIFISNHPMCNAYFQTAVNSDGRFCFRCVPAGRYDLKIKGPGGYNQTFVSFIQLDPGDSEEDVILQIPALGELKVNFCGFSCEDLKELKISYLPASSEATVLMGPCKETVLAFEEGPLTLTASHPRSGDFSRTVEIMADKRSELTLDRTDLSTLPLQTVACYGRLAGNEGSPFANKWFELFSLRTGKTGGSVYKGRTDDAGRLSLENVEPGNYGLRLVLFDEQYDQRFKDQKYWNHRDFPITSYTFYDIEITESDPFLFERFLSKGAVTGTVVDRMSNEPIVEKKPRWTISVNTIDRGIKTVAAQYNSSDVNRFTLSGLPAGDHYYLEIDRPDYFHYRSSLFSLKEGELLDLGVIRMEPSGIVETVVRNPVGQIIRTYDVYCNEMKLGQNGGLKMYTVFDPILMKRFSGLRVGSVTIRIHAKGYVDQEIPVTLHPGVPQRVEVILQPISEKTE
ncbi:MAG: carboxypeptidase-like regulatory domain-containing protein, partial [Planctomycetota bacterium]